MARYRPTDQERRERAAARADIVAAATKHRQQRVTSHGLAGVVFVPSSFGPRHLHQAVAVCRAHGLVADAVLVAAGFRPRRRPGRHARQAVSR